MLPEPYYDQDGITIYHGDVMDVLHELNGIGAVVTDPPYSSGGMVRSDRMQSTITKYVNSDTATRRPEFSGDNRDQRSFLAWATMWLNACREASIPGAPIICFTDWRQLPTMTDAIQCGGWVWRNLATWWKPGCRMQKGRFSSSAEYIVYGTNGPAVEGAKSPQNVYSCAIADDKQHIAQKPLEVMKWAMGIVPEDAGVVLDPFLGSGSTLIAARDMGFRSIGIESDESSIEIAIGRLRQKVMF